MLKTRVHHIIAASVLATGLMLSSQVMAAFTAADASALNTAAKAMLE